MTSGIENCSLASDASLRLADSSCTRLLKEKLICSLPTLYIKCVMRLRAVGWGMESSLRTTREQGCCWHTRRTDCELREKVKSVMRWYLRGQRKWVHRQQLERAWSSFTLRSSTVISLCMENKNKQGAVVMHCVVFCRLKPLLPWPL